MFNLVASAAGITENISLDQIEELDNELLQHFCKKLVVQHVLSRSLVSFQANKTRPVYRWYKFKEAFSASLVEYLFQKYQVNRPPPNDL